MNNISLNSLPSLPIKLEDIAKIKNKISDVTSHFIKELGVVFKEGTVVYNRFKGSLNALSSRNATLLAVGVVCTAVGVIYAVNRFTRFPEIIKENGKVFLQKASSVSMTIANKVTYLTGIANRGFTTDAPEFKKTQVKEMFGDIFYDRNKKDDISTMKKFLIGLPEKNIKAMEELLDMLSADFNQDAPKLRYDFLMKLEDVCQVIDYEKRIEEYLEALEDDKYKLFPDIDLLLFFAFPFTETPIWNQSVDELSKHLKHKLDENVNYNDLGAILKSDVAKMKAVEPKGVMINTAINFEKLAMQNGNGEATNYRYNYSSKLGVLNLGNEQKVTWNRMGSPSMDVGSSSEPAKLTALYTLYLDSCVARDKKLGFIGLQQGPKVDQDGNMTGFVPGNYEKNRTAAFIQASQKPRWKHHFHFTNLSLDDIENDKILKLKNPKTIEKYGISEEKVSMETFARQLLKLMENNEAGFYGVPSDRAIKAIEAVADAFFPNDDDLLLDDKQRWAFVILTYGMIALSKMEEEGLDIFHTNCKDGIDRAAVINAAIMMISQFENQCNVELQDEELHQNIENIRTMFSHAAWFVKLRAVIPARAPLAYYAADQLAFAAQQHNKDDRLYVLKNYGYTTFSPFLSGKEQEALNDNEKEII